MLSNKFIRIIRSFKSGSIAINDPKIIKDFLADPYFPVLISFPRTGSHWLRMLMELYFKKPALVRAFYYKDATDFTCYHTHDMELDVERRNVLYLYRDPVRTIYSQLRYYKEDVDDITRINHWTTLYGNHLAKWLFEETFSRKKTILTYEGLKQDIYMEFGKVCQHFGENLEKGLLTPILERISKEELKKKTRHDNQVVDLSEAYTMKQHEFEQRYGELVRDLLIKRDHHLESVFTRPQPSSGNDRIG
jgi:hypothetical protein